MWGGEESVSRGSGAVVTSERHAATCVLRFLLGVWGGRGVFFLVRGRRLAATSRALEEDRKQNNLVYVNTDCKRVCCRLFWGFFFFKLWKI